MDQKIKNLIDNGMDRNIVGYDSDACCGHITDRLISIAKTLFTSNEFNGKKYEPSKMYLGYGAVGQLEHRILYCKEKMMDELLENAYITQEIYDAFFTDKERIIFEEIKGKLVSYFGLELVVVDGFDEMDSNTIWHRYLAECNFSFDNDVSLIIVTDETDTVPLLCTY